MVAPVKLAFVLLAAAALVAAAARIATRAPYPRPLRLETAGEPADPAERGRLVYARFGCAMCHKADGRGGFANTNAETGGKVPGVVFVAEGYTPQELRQKIREGVRTVGRADPKGVTPPFRMPGWGDRMSARELDDLVKYLMSLYPEKEEEKWR